MSSLERKLIKTVLFEVDSSKNAPLLLPVDVLCDEYYATDSIIEVINTGSGCVSLRIVGFRQENDSEYENRVQQEAEYELRIKNKKRTRRK